MADVKEDTPASRPDLSESRGSESRGEKKENKHASIVVETDRSETNGSVHDRPFDVGSNRGPGGRHSRTGSNVSWHDGGSERSSGVFAAQAMDLKRSSSLGDISSSGSGKFGKDRRNRRRSLREKVLQKEIPPMPFNTAFQQQTMATWRPKQNTTCMLLCLFFVAASCATLGAMIVVANDSVTEIVIRYDHVHDYTWNTALGSFTYKTSTKSELPLPFSSTSSLQNAPSSANVSGLSSFEFGPSFPLKNFSADNTTSAQGVRTVVTFTVPKDITDEVNIFYGMTEFYQSHRRYRKSRSYDQMTNAEQGISFSDLVQCVPYRSPGDEEPASDQTITIDGNVIPMNDISYSPCGLGAWSKFNDSYEIYSVGSPDQSILATTATVSGIIEGVRLQDYSPELDTQGGVRLICNTSDFVAGEGSAFLANSNYSSKGGAAADPSDPTSLCSKKGIAWKTDIEHQYKSYPASTPNVWHSELDLSSSDNDFYNQRWYNREAGHSVPSVRDEDFMVWMRFSPRPTLRKVYRRFENGLKAGTYVVVIREFFDAYGFGGSKSIIIANRSWIGGKGNLPLAIAFIAIAGTSFVLFLAIGLRALLLPKGERKKTRRADDN